MKKYEYRIFRYYPDLITGEFVNIGILIFSADLKFLGFEGISRSKRITAFFQGINSHHILRVVKYVNKKVTEINKKLSTELNLESINNLDIISKQIIPLDDSSLRFSDSKLGITLDIEATLQNLFDNIVIKFETTKEKKSRSDEDASRIVYKEYFDRYNISGAINTQVVETKRDKFEFDGWINGKWHYYKPVSFDLVEKESIKEKVYRWSGMLKELSTSNKEFNLYLLALEPKSESNSTISFIKEVLEVNSENITVKVIRESEFESFAKAEKNEMEEYRIKN